MEEVCTLLNSTEFIIVNLYATHCKVCNRNYRDWGIQTVSVLLCEAAALEDYTRIHLSSLQVRVLGLN